MRWSQWILVGALHQVFTNVLIGTSAAPTVPVAVTEVLVIRGATKEDAYEQCDSMCPCRPLLSTHITSNWHLVGGNINSTKEGNEAWGNSMSNSSADGFAYVSLCIRQDPIGAIQVDPSVFFLLQSIHVIEAEYCPSTMTTLLTPRKHVVVCVQSIPASLALATGMFISDVTTSSAVSAFDAVSGWSVQPISIELSEDDSVEAASTTVYLSYERPVRPISNVRVVSSDHPLMMDNLCRTELSLTWETVGTIASNENDSWIVVCVERPFVTGSALTKTTSAFDNALVNVEAADADVDCENSSDEVVIITDWIKLCLTYANSSASSTYITELKLVHGATTPSLSASASGSLSLSRNYTTLSSSGLDDGLDEDEYTFLICRTHEVYSDLHQESLPTTPNTTSFNNSDNPPLQAQVHYTSGPNDNDRHSKQLVYKIVQIADLHITGDPSWPCRTPSDELQQCGIKCTEALTTAFVEDILDLEQPDFVVFSGDNIQVLDAKLRQDAIEAVVRPVEARGIPYAMVLGNHDDDNGFDRKAIAAAVVGRPLSYMQEGPESVFGVGNYELNVKAPIDGPWGFEGDTVFRMYFLDSNKKANTTLFPNASVGYDWIRKDQIDFYRELAQLHRAMNEQVPAIMYFHIPIPEYDITDTNFQQRGDKCERVSSPKFNSQLFASLVELEDVKATFVGHDHINEYCTKRDGIQLCYGGGTGFGESYSRPAFTRRARILEWSVDEQMQQAIRTWKRHFGSNFTERQHEEVLYSSSSVSATYPIPTSSPTPTPSPTSTSSASGIHSTASLWSIYRSDHWTSRSIGARVVLLVVLGRRMVQ